MSRELVEKAQAAAAHAYAPYSNYLVGAVVRAKDGREFAGVNVDLRPAVRLGPVGFARSPRHFCGRASWASWM